MCFLILRAKLIIIETLPCYCPSFYKTSNTTIDMGGRLTLNFPFSTLAPFENFRFDLLRRIECVIVVYGGRCQDTPVHALYRYVLQVDMDVLALPGIYVCQRDMDFYPASPGMRRRLRPALPVVSYFLLVAD